jgi:hypothetical protein
MVGGVVVGFKQNSVTLVDDLAESANHVNGFKDVFSQVSRRRNLAQEDFTVSRKRVARDFPNSFIG